jgi:phage gp45-like
MTTTMVIANATLGVDKHTIQGMQASWPYTVRQNIPMFGLHGDVSRPLPGAQLVLLLPNGDPTRAVCIGHNDPRYYASGLPDGCVGKVHHMGHSILLYSDRIEIQGGGKPVVIKNAQKLRVEAPIESTGEITAQVDGGAVHLSTHRHTGVQSGAGTSGAPVPGT